MKKMLLLLSPMMAMLFVFAKCDDDEQLVELPATIHNYINNNYSGYKIEASETDTLCTGTAVYEVELEGSKDKEVELTFDTEGNLLFTETGIAANQLPPAVTNSINAKYAGHTLQEAEQLNLIDGSLQYEVELKKDQAILEVLFAADGMVVCEQPGDDDDDDE